MTTEEVLEKLKIGALNDMQQAAVQVGANGRDLVLLSPTGSGKTLAFLLSVLHRLDAGYKGTQALVIVPSRELALQVTQVFRQMGTGFKVSCCYGGHPVRTELRSFEQPPVLLVGTPGRIAYHLEAGNFDESGIRTLVLDEFDKALELGFQEDMSYVIRMLRSLKQRILTSATAMEEIPAFAGMHDPEEVNFLDSEEAIPDLRLKKVSLPAAEQKPEALLQLICKIGTEPVLVFCNHRETVDRISGFLNKKGLVHDRFHGGMEQEARERALLKFRNGSIHILLTTDLAARGLDIPEVAHVIHYQLPHTRAAFLHRNGRTARMKSTGTAYLMIAAEEQYTFLSPDIETEDLKGTFALPPQSEWQTIYIGAGRKDKIGKVDIAGLLLKKGGLQKEEVGLIEVKDQVSYVAVKREKTAALLKALAGEKVRNKKTKIAIAK